MNYSTDPEDQLDWGIHGNALGIDDAMKLDFSSSQTVQMSCLIDPPITDTFLVPDDDIINMPSFPSIMPSTAKSPTEILTNYIDNSILAMPLASSITLNPSIICSNSISISSSNNSSSTNHNLMSNLCLHNNNNINMNFINTPETKSYVLPEIVQVPKSPSNSQIMILMKNMAKMANSKSKTEPLPPVPKIASTEEIEFDAVCNDSALLFNPRRLKFIPSKFWDERDFTFGELVVNFFRRKSNSNNRFYHKLYNALKITDDDPFYSEYIGVEWITPVVIRVDKIKFARLLGIKTIDGSLFHHQGNFPSHGFVELTTQNASEQVSENDLKNVDFDNVRLFIHQAGVFVQGCTEEVINDCKWINVRKGPQYYH